MKAMDVLREAQQACGRSLAVVIRDVGHGMLEVGHNTLAVLGLAVVAVLVFTGGRADLRHEIEAHAYAWLQTRHEERELASGNVLAAVAEPEAITRATATDPKGLTRQQAAVAQWISRRYKVAPEPISALVQEAWAIGQRAGLDPTLILAIMAIESSFNPFAQSPVGAQGLMQVMPRFHADKLPDDAGELPFFDPVTNVQVGSRVLRESISRNGGLVPGLQQFGGAINDPDRRYSGKVLAERERLEQAIQQRMQKA